jgi:dTDP-4-dehydrorhamnose 3,5-epimerase
MLNNTKFINIKKNYDKRGFFSEIVRFSSFKENFIKAQISHSRVKKNVIKGWHGHKIQYQWNYIVRGSILLVLYDNNPLSKTYKKHIKKLIGHNSDNCAYLFSPGILHSYKCISNFVDIIYITSDIYDQINEIKIDISSKIIKYEWKK